MTRAFPQERAGERLSGLVVIGQQAGIKDYDTARHPA